MEPSNVNPSAANLIPAAHIPQAMAAAGNTKNPNVMAQLQAMQQQLSALMGLQSQEDMADVVLVNASGRIVEVDGKTAMELLSKPGFRKATEEEETRYRKAILLQTPAYLRRMEKKRLQDEQALLDELEAEEASTDGASVEDLLKAPVTDAQKSGTPAPVAPATPAPAAQSQNTTQSTQTANDTNTNTSADESTPKPPSRRAKAAQSQNTTNTTENNTQTNTAQQ